MSDEQETQFSTGAGEGEEGAKKAAATAKYDAGTITVLACVPRS